jgi:hypothetical protein
MAAGTDSPSGPIWSQGHYFPTFPAVSNLFVLDISNQVNNDPQALTLLSLQGIVNRDSPQIYLILDQYSSFWLQYAKTAMPSLQTTQLSSATDLISRFASKVKGVVVYDPSVPDTINVATTIAGLENRLIVDPSSLPTIQQILGQVDVIDLRTYVSNLGWSNSPSGRVLLYQWVFNNLWPNCDKRMIGVENPGAPVSSYGLSLATRDYIVALHLVTLYLDPTQPDQAALYKKFLSTAPSPIPIFGWVDTNEDPTVSLVSSYGDWVAVLSHVNNPTYPADLTVLSGLQVQPMKYTPQIDQSAMPQTVPAGVYVTAYVSDGDNIGYDYSFGFSQWDAYRNIGVPVGWTINPTLIDIAPLIWNYYVASKGVATFVAGASGAGYALPSAMSVNQLSAYLSNARGYWQATGLATAQVLGTTSTEGVDWSSSNGQYAQLYANNLGPLGLFDGYYSSLEPNMLPYPLGTSSNVFFESVSGIQIAPNAYSVGSNSRHYWSQSQVVSNLLLLAHGQEPSGPVSFAAANLPEFGEVVSDPTSTSGSVVVGHSSETYGGCLVFGPYITLPPGHYEVTFHVKISNVKVPGPLAVLDVAGDQAHEILAEKQIASTDLPTDSWQDVSLSFSPTAITRNVEFRVTFLSGTADLSVDTINLFKLDGWQTTNGAAFVSLELITTSSPSQRAQFLQQLATLDPRIHVLNTDEFFAMADAYMSNSTSTSTTQTTTTTTSSSLTIAPKAIISNGGASIDTSQSKFGGASGKFVASSTQYVTTPSSSDFNYGTADMTVDFWVRFNSLPSGKYMYFLSQRQGTSGWNDRCYFYVENDGTHIYLVFGTVNAGSTAQAAGAATLTTGTWYHIAFVVASGVDYVFVNGASIGSLGSNGLNFANWTGNLFIGAQVDTGDPLDGWIDEFRISKGIARWTSNFTPPTAPYSRDTQTVLLVHMDGANGSTTFLDDVGVDTTPPVITPTVTPSANGNGWNNRSVTVTWSVSDPESGIASSNGCTTTTLSTETPPAGTTLTCSAINGAGLSNLASVTVKIDLTAPTLKLSSLTVNATGPSGAVVSYSASASDSLSGLNTFSCTPPSGSAFPLGTTTVSCSATDKAGNSASGTLTVSVQDKTPPTLTLPSDMTVQATSSSGAIVKYTASASDLVDGSVPVACTPASGSTFPIGTTTVTCSATDKAGNSASGLFRVTVSAVTVTLLNSSGNGLSGGVVQYYNGGWKSFGTTSSNGTVSMWLPLGTYIFQITYAGASMQKTQNIATNPNVVFQTAQVHSDSGKCNSYIQVATVPTRYHAVGWQTFTQDMELLPGTYTFRFSDGTANTSYTLVVGAVKHIH